MAATSRYDILKRNLDVIGAAFALVILSPVLLITSAVVIAALGRPVLFSQLRPGLDGKPFRLRKFRTMRSLDAQKGWVTNEERMTRTGRLLRTTSVDELPSLWNIVRGDMSFVGPRPLRMSYLDRYSPEQRRRHEVRPGLTGLAQVGGRNSIGWDERIMLDVQYVKKRGLKLDLSILFATVKAVLIREGITGEDTATMTEFFGPERTSRMHLRDLGAEHLATRTEWLSDERIRKGISISFVPDLDSMHKWFSRVAGDGTREDWVGIDTATGALVSMCGLVHERPGRASLYIYVAPGQLGRGWGTDTMLLLITRARKGGVTSLELETPTTNSSARRMYERLGFEEIGSVDQGRKVKMRKRLTTGHMDV